MALGEIGDKRAITPLENALKDDYWATRQRVARALKKITGKDYQVAPGPLQKEYAKKLLTSHILNLNENITLTYSENKSNFKIRS